VLWETTKWTKDGRREPGVFDKGMDDRGIVEDHASIGGYFIECTLVYISGGESQYKS